MRSGLKKRILAQLVASAAILFPLLAATYTAAFLLRFAGQLRPSEWQIYLATLLWVLVIKWVAFVWFRLHQNWTRFVGFHDLLIISQAVTCGALGITLIDAMCLPHVTIPRSIILIDWGATLLALGAVRALPRVVRHGAWYAIAPGKGTPSLIVGANDSGEALLRAIHCNPVLTYRVVGFVDDRKALLGRRIAGVPVLGTCSQLPQLAERYGVEEVLITSGELPGKQVRRLVEDADAHGFRVKVLPSYEQLLAESVAVRPRQVAIEDLLRRDSIELDLDVLRGWLAGRVVMVTGSAGSIGSEICRQLLKLQPAKLVLVDRAETGQFFLERELMQLARTVVGDTDCGLRHPENMRDRGSSTLNPKSEIRNPKSTTLDVRLADLTDQSRLAAIFAQTRPEVIFHAAAYKHVPLMESHCGEAVKNIVLATRNLIDLADEHESRALVMISTDKAVNPTSVMGSCKRLAEHYVQARSAGSNCRFVTVRFGNVLDSSGSVVPIFREQIARGGPVTITHPDIIRYFMLIPEAAQLVIQAGAMGQGGEIFVLDMGEPVRIIDLAHDLIRLSGLRVGEDIEIEITGLRPGEKLFEELYDSAETHQRTTHPKIMVAASQRRNLLQLIADIRHLESLVDEPNEVVKAALGDVIPLHGASTTIQHRAAA
jgi:FlaA1/EpsC-like NDP-sugar epimerase